MSILSVKKILLIVGLIFLSLGVVYGLSFFGLIGFKLPFTNQAGLKITITSDHPRVDLKPDDLQLLGEWLAEVGFGEKYPTAKSLTLILTDNSALTAKEFDLIEFFYPNQPRSAFEFKQNDQQIYIWFYLAPELLAKENNNQLVNVVLADILFKNSALNASLGDFKTARNKFSAILKPYLEHDRLFVRLIEK
jgi:hypothetical protein